MRMLVKNQRWFVLFILWLFYVPTTNAQEGLKAGVKAPDFELPTTTGKKVSLNSFLNKNIVILHFWKSK